MLASSLVGKIETQMVDCFSWINGKVFLFLKTVLSLVSTLKQTKSLSSAAERPRALSLEWQELPVKTESGAQPPVPHRDFDR